MEMLRPAKLALEVAAAVDLVEQVEAFPDEVELDGFAKGKGLSQTQVKRGEGTEVIDVARDVGQRATLVAGAE